MSVVIDIVVTLITCFMIIGITFWGYSWLTVRRSTTNMQHYLLSARKDKMLDEERNIQRLAKSFADMGCSVGEAVEALDKMTTTIVDANNTVEINLYNESRKDNHPAIYVGVNGVARRVKKVYIGINGKPKSTNCPNCGAPVDIHAEKCAYCDTPYI